MLRIFDLLYQHHLVEQGAGIVQADIRIGIVGHITLRLFERDQLESFFVEQIEGVGQNRAAERSQMHQQNIINLAAENEFRLLAPEIEKFGSRI